MERVKEIISRYISGDEKIAVGVSGGMDSLCLLHFLITQSGLKKENIIAVNIEHGIRGAESLSDSEFVKDYCFQNGVEVIFKRLSVLDDAARNGRSVETEARLQRKKFFDELLTQGRVSKVLLAHHADDQCETVLMHIFRGSGLSGIKGMAVLSGGYLRPFLVLSKKEIAEYAKINNIPYREDSTNSDIHYNRNFVRHEILPLIRTRWPGVDKALLRLSASAAKEDEFLESMIDDKLIKYDNGVVFLNIEALKNETLAPRYIIKSLKRLGLEYDFEYTHLKRIIELKEAENGSRVTVIHGVCAIREYESISFFFDSEREPFCVDFRLGEIDLPVGKLCIKTSDNKPVKGVLRVDYDAVPTGAVIRNRRDGDIFKPFGGGSKKLKEYLIDKKIPVRIRDSMPVIAVSDRVYVACGLEISDEVKITSATVHAVQIDFAGFKGVKL